MAKVVEAGGKVEAGEQGRGGQAFVAASGVADDVVEAGGFLPEAELADLDPARDVTEAEISIGEQPQTVFTLVFCRLTMLSLHAVSLGTLIRRIGKFASSNPRTHPHNDAFGESDRNAHAPAADVFHFV